MRRGGEGTFARVGGVNGENDAGFEGRRRPPSSSCLEREREVEEEEEEEGERK